ncbi:MAG: hypothetical protein IJ846_07825 [Alphaproteobacteria bacterium]|nr:hypothetical protein [Alphaproteobacteria bacterium]
MLTLFFLLILFSFPTAAQEQLNWQPLEVTVVEEEEEEAAAPSFQQADKRFRSLMTDLKSSLEKKSKKKNRKVEAVNKETVYSAIVEMIETSYPGGLDAMVRANEQLEDDIYRLILTLPKYAYQYIGPFIHEMPYVSDRILNIPGIKETKGKFPTRIAPQMREYAKKYGKYMSTHLYIYLMPEAWALPEREKSTFKGYNKIISIDENGKPEGLFDVKNRSLLTKYKMPDPAKYQSREALKKNVRPQTPADQVTQTSPLTEGDVEAALASFQNIEQAFGNNRFDEFHTALRDMSLSDNNLMGELLNPMQVLVDKINRLPEKEKFAKTVAKNGFTPESWGITVDKIIKARRVAKMSPAVALTLSAWRKLKKPPKSFDVLTPRDRQISWDSIQLFLGMYSSSRENLLAVKNYGDNIRKVFATRDMMVIETPVYGIY